MLYPDVKAAPADWVAQPALFVAGQHHEGHAFGRNGPKLGNGELPGGEDLKQHGLESIVNLIELVNKQNTRLFALESPHQRPWAEEIPALQVGLQELPALMLPLRELHASQIDQSTKNDLVSGSTWVES